MRDAGVGVGSRRRVRGGERLRRRTAVSDLLLAGGRVVLLARALAGGGSRTVGIESLLALARAGVGLGVVTRGERRGQETRRQFYVVGLPPIARDAVDADFDLGWVAEVGLVEVLGADGERGELREGGRRAEAPLLDVLDLVVGDEVLGDAADAEGERLGAAVSIVATRPNAAGSDCKKRESRSSGTGTNRGVRWEGRAVSGSLGCGQDKLTGVAFDGLGGSRLRVVREARVVVVGC